VPPHGQWPLARSGQQPPLSDSLRTDTGIEFAIAALIIAHISSEKSMKLFASAAAGLLMLTADVSQLHLPYVVLLDSTEKEKLLEALAAKGLNCPLITNYQFEAIDARGNIFRITCSTAPKPAPSWDIRMIEPAHIDKAYFEPW
jgi:hypothetical protein